MAGRDLKSLDLLMPILLLTKASPSQSFLDIQVVNLSQNVVKESSTSNTIPATKTEYTFAFDSTTILMKTSVLFFNSLMLIDESILLMKH